MARFDIRGMAHITGGGFQKNIPRMIPKGMGALIKDGSWPVLEIFKYLQKWGKVSEEEMRRVFNRGIGFVLVLSPMEAKRLCHEESDCYPIGEVVEGEGLIWR